MQENIDEDKSLVHHHGADDDSDSSSSHHSQSTPPTSPDAKREKPFQGRDGNKAAAKGDAQNQLAAQMKEASLHD